MRSSKLRNAILVISTILVFVLLGGFVASIVTETPPNEWFKKDDVIIDEPVVEEVLPLVASNEEEMNALLVEENVGRTVTYTGETVKSCEFPFNVGDKLLSLSFDTSVDITDWVLGLDWEDPHSQNVGETAYVKGFYVMTCGGPTIADVKATNGDLNVYTPMTIIRRYEQRSEGDIDVYFMVSGSTYLWIYDVYDNYADWEGWADASGSSDFPNLTFGDYGDTSIISDIDYSLISPDFMFLGPEEGNYGSVEVVYENNVEYLIVANENGDGCHFEKID